MATYRESKISHIFTNIFTLFGTSLTVLPVLKTSKEIFVSEISILFSWKPGHLPREKACYML